jgi:hypothetical protein
VDFQKSGLCFVSLEFFFPSAMVCARMARFRGRRAPPRQQTVAGSHVDVPNRQLAYAFARYPALARRRGRGGSPAAIEGCLCHSRRIEDARMVRQTMSAQVTGCVPPLHAGSTGGGGHGLGRNVHTDLRSPSWDALRSQSLGGPGRGRPSSPHFGLWSSTGSGGACCAGDADG